MVISSGKEGMLDPTSQIYPTFNISCWINSISVFGHCSLRKQYGVVLNIVHTIGHDYYTAYSISIVLAIAHCYRSGNCPKDFAVTLCICNF